MSAVLTTFHFRTGKYGVVGVRRSETDFFLSVVEADAGGTEIDEESSQGV